MEAAARVPFTTTTAFRNASYAPLETIALKTLTTAAERYEEITGQEVDVEESAIAQAFKKVAEQEQMDLLPILAKAQANALPFKDELADYQSTAEPNSKRRDRRLRKNAGRRGAIAKAKYRTRSDHTR